MKSTKRILSLLFCLFLFAALWAAAPASAAGTQPDADAGYIVKLRADMPMLLLAEPDLAPIAYADGYYTADSLDAIQPYLDAGLVEYVGPDAELELLGTPLTNDPELSEQWYLQTLGIDATWAAGLDGSGVTVAVIDSGIYEDHPDFTGAQIRGYNFLGTVPAPENYADDTGHGTFVAGILAAQCNNGVGTAGLTDGVEILALRCFAKSSGGNENYGSASVSVVLSAIGYALEQGADVINMSFGGTNYASLAPLEEKLQQAADAGVLLVAASGNRGETALYYPAAFDCVIGVGSVDSDGQRSSFSQHNESVFVSAPGSAIRGLGYTAGTLYCTDGGTSYAAPVVAAFAAMAKQANPDIDQAGFQYLLMQCAVDHGEPGYDTSFGYGVVQAERFLAALQRENTISYETCGGSIADSGYATSYRIDRESPVLLPTHVTRDYHVFSGWYTTPDFSGAPVTQVPDDAFGDVMFYANWTAIDYTVSSVTAGGVPATATEHGYTVRLPYGYDLSTLKPEDIQVRFSDARAALAGAPEKAAGDDSGANWTFSAGGTVHSLQIELSTIPLPVVTLPSPAVHATAAPASYDGLTAAVPYLADVSGWFAYPDSYAEQTPLSYTASIVSGTGRMELNGSELQYLPTAADAGTEVCLSVQAVNADGFACADGVSVSIEVAPVPVSDSLLVQPERPYDLDSDRDGYTLTLRPFGNTLVSISHNGQALAADWAYSLSDFPEMEDSDQLCTLSHAWLSTLPAGSHTLQFTFSAGRTEATRVVPLTLDLLAEQTVTFYNGTAVFESKTVPYNSPLALPAETPQKEGSTFKGWYTAQSGGTPAVAGTPVTGPLTFYAQWDTTSGGGGGGGMPSGGGGTAAGEDVETDSLLLTVPGLDSPIPYTVEAGCAILSADDALSAALSHLPAPVFDFSASPDITSIAIPESLSAALAGHSLTLRLAGGELELYALEGGNEIYFGLSPVDAAGRTDYALILTGHGRANAVLRLSYVCGEGESPRMQLESSGKISDLLCAFDTQKGRLCAAVPGSGTLSVTSAVASLPFTDIGKDSWYADSVAFVTLHGLFNGTGPATFSPDSTMTRAMLTTVLWRLAGAPSIQSEKTFSDIAAGSWYADAVSWAVATGLVEGTGDGCFAPDAAITREQLMTILYRYAGSLGRSQTVDTDVLSAFHDRASLSAFAVDAAGYMVQHGVITGTEDARLLPQAVATRAQMAATLSRFIAHILF